MSCVGSDFQRYAFPATGTTFRRTLPDRLSDIPNVKDWGALGNGADTSADVTGIQAAINFAMSRGGGTVLVPAGAYVIQAPGLALGSNTYQNARVELIGCGCANTSIGASGTVPPTNLISNGGLTYDNFGSLRSISATGAPILLQGVNQSVTNCVVSRIDASQALGAYISDISGSGGLGVANPPGSASPGYSSGSYSLALGSGCIGQNCRFGAGGEIVFMLSGYNPSVIGSSCEVDNIGVRVGWAPTFALTATASGTNTVTFASFPNSGVVLGRFVTGTNIPASTFITDIDATNHVITLSNNTTGSVTGAVTFGNECPAYGWSICNHQTERNDVAFDLYNAQGGFMSGVITQGQQGSWPSPGQDITNITWAAGTATATTIANHNLPTGQQILQLVSGSAGGAVANWQPTYGTPPGWIIATVGATPNQFTYDLPVDPGISYATKSFAWTNPQLYTVRCRKVFDTAFFGLGLTQQSAYAAIDFNYDGDTNAQHRNNVIWGATGLVWGFALPAARNLAGWTFVNTSGAVNQLEGHAGWTGKSTVAVADGHMVFANLPGQSGVVQPGPYEGQEFNITDGAKSGGGSALFADATQGGGTQHIRVRYTAGSINAWTRMA